MGLTGQYIANARARPCWDRVSSKSNPVDGFSTLAGCGVKFAIRLPPELLQTVDDEQECTFHWTLQLHVRVLDTCTARLHDDAHNTPVVATATVLKVCEVRVMQSG